MTHRRQYLAKSTSCMIDAGVVRISEEYCDDYVGPLRTKYHPTHPEICLVVDEVGSNSLQRSDGHIEGLKYQYEMGMIPQIRVSHSNERHFTTLGFTSLNGEAVLCLIIISGAKEMREIEIEIDIDIEADVIGQSSDPNYFEKNRDKIILFLCWSRLCI